MRTPQPFFPSRYSKQAHSKSFPKERFPFFSQTLPATTDRWSRDHRPMVTGNVPKKNGKAACKIKNVLSKIGNALEKCENCFGRDAKARWMIHHILSILVRFRIVRTRTVCLLTFYSLSSSKSNKIFMNFFLLILYTRTSTHAIIPL